MLTDARWDCKQILEIISTRGEPSILALFFCRFLALPVATSEQSASTKTSLPLSEHVSQVSREDLRRSLRPTFFRLPGPANPARMWREGRQGTAGGTWMKGTCQGTK